MCTYVFFLRLLASQRRSLVLTVPNLDLKYQLHILDLAWLIKIYFQKIFIETV